MLILHVFGKYSQYHNSNLLTNELYFPGCCYLIACVAGVQRGGRGKVECESEARREREARSLGAR